MNERIAAAAKTARIAHLAAAACLAAIAATAWLSSFSALAGGFVLAALLVAGWGWWWYGQLLTCVQSDGTDLVEGSRLRGGLLLTAELSASGPVAAWGSRELRGSDRLVRMRPAATTPGTGRAGAWGVVAWVNERDVVLPVMPVRAYCRTVKVTRPDKSSLRAGHTGAAAAPAAASGAASSNRPDLDDFRSRTAPGRGAAVLGAPRDLPREGTAYSDL